MAVLSQFYVPNCNATKRMLLQEAVNPCLNFYHNWHVSGLLFSERNGMT